MAMNVNNAPVQTNNYAQTNQKTNAKQTSEVNAANVPVETPAYAYTPSDEAKTAKAADDLLSAIDENGNVDKVKMSKFLESTAIEQKQKLFEIVLNSVVKDQAKKGQGLGDLLQNITVSPEVKSKAQELVGEGGYYSVDVTSQRLFDTAMAFSGGDPKKMVEMRAAVEQGFGDAQKDWGKNKMPQITADTYDATMKLFDDYEASITGAATVAK